MPNRTLLIAGNWKMNNDVAEAAKLADELAHHENLTVLQGLPATRERADDELAIIDYKEVVQIRS